jgi:SAM-dependent methyltransferase
MTPNKSFDELIADADDTLMNGWEFSFLEGRWVEEPTTWDLKSRIEMLFPQVLSLLDMGTGGGEFLRSLLPLPGDTTATEAYGPNVVVARDNLEPLGIQVIDTTTGPLLPFPEERFDLVMNRHEAFEPADVFRIVKGGGRFITQQVGGRDMMDINTLIQDDPHGHFDYYNKDFVMAQLESAGFQIEDHLEEIVPTHIYDVGAIVVMLKVTPWQVDDFSVDRYREPLRKIHELIHQRGRLTIGSHRFLIQAMRP